MADISVIPLKFKTAEQVIPLITPLVEQEVKLSGQSFQLIVSANSEQTQLIKQLIEKIDLAPQSYRIELRINDQQGKQQNSFQLNTNLSTQGARVSSKVISTHRQNSDQLQQTVRATEGYPAYINTGEFIPTAFHFDFASAGLEYSEVLSGFYAIPQQRADGQVLLTIQQQKQQVAPFPNKKINPSFQKQRPVIQHQDLSTQLLVPLDQWVVLGEVSQQQSQRPLTSTGKSYSTNAAKYQQQQLMIKIVQVK